MFKRPRWNFRNVDSYDEDAVPVKVTYFEGDSMYDVNESTPRELIDNEHAISEAVAASRSTTLPVVNTRNRSFDTPAFPADDFSATYEPPPLGNVVGSEDDDSLQGKGAMNKKRLWVILACLFVLGVTMLAAGIAVRKKNNNNKSKNSISSGQASMPTPSPTSSNTVSITSAPTFPPSQLAGLDLWIETLKEVTDPLTLRQDTPQYDALKWISSVDTANMDPEITPTSQLIERYIAAVLYFATNGDEWSQDFNFLDGDTICSWNSGGPDGITCNGEGSVTSVFIGKFIAVFELKRWTCSYF